ncbi:CRISPR-associated protein, Csx3 family [Calothrix sp. 336/3]|uniref:CRISPR-associated protein, Csx3 family n=1 Tax=Calothrix sp. 336/3 TaxID=1337936 RepID=UPI0004E2963F|nr:CRISPR-associated protein, Csx3 family [Calothrix sp. 336/3]AKG20253.1 CRISPR-associated protein, Csx3 family [Calothrix sp. 336/3]
MSTYHIDLDGDILQVGFGETIATGDKIVQDVVVLLDAMIASGEIPGGELIKINGRASVLVSQVLAYKLAQIYEAIAFFDPKIGDKGLDRYVVTVSNNPKYQIGDILDVNREENPSHIKVVICGFANTGKTCFREGLKQALIHIPNAPKSYVISGCPDGDGSWFSDTAKRDFELAKKLKAEYKTKFTPAFAQFKAQEFRNVKEPIFIFDVGGQISPENRIIMAEATHAVILVKEDKEISIWENFCKSLSLQVLAIVFSDYHGIKDFIESETPILKGRVHRLQRGVDVWDREIIQALAKILVSKVRG